MPDPAAWQAFGGVGAVIVFLGAVAFALKRLGVLGQQTDSSPPPAASAATCVDVQGDLTERVHTLERELDGFKLRVAENYVRRDDYVTNESRVIGILEGHSEMLARLEERIGSGAV